MTKKIGLGLLVAWLLLLIISYFLPFDLKPYQANIIQAAEQQAIQILAINNIKLSIGFPFTPTVIGQQIEFNHEHLQSGTLKKVKIRISLLEYLLKGQLVDEVSIKGLQIKANLSKNPKPSSEMKMPFDEIELLSQYIKHIELTDSLFQIDNNDYQIESLNIHLNKKKITVDGHLGINHIPIQLGSKFYLHPNQYELKIKQLKINHSDVSGFLKATYKKDFWYYSGSIESDYLSLSDLTNIQSQEKNEFSQTKIPLAWFQYTKGYVPVKIEQFNIGSIDLENVNLEIKSENDLQIALEPIALGQGHITGHLNYSPQNNNIFILNLDGSELPIEKLLRGEKGALASKSLIKISAAFQSRGQNTQDILQQLSGHITAEASQGQIKNTDVLQNINFVSSLLNQMNPLVKQEKESTLECAVIHFKANNGHLNAHDGIGIRLNSIDILGSGTINLHNGALNITIKPTIRSGLNIELTDFAELVELKGTLSEPTIGVSATGVLKKTGNIAAAIFTGGLSTVTESVLSEIKDNNVNPCDLARQGQ